MINAGFPVPDGFHITTEAYRQFIAANGLQTKIIAVLKSLDACERSVRLQLPEKPKLRITIFNVVKLHGRNLTDRINASKRYERQTEAER